MCTCIKEPLPWIPPLTAASLFSETETCFVLLHSGQQRESTGRYSYLALHPLETVSGDRFSLLADKFGNDAGVFDNAWFGYFGYELLHDMESLPCEVRGYITLPDLWFTRFGLILVFDNQEKTLTSHRAPDALSPAILYSPLEGESASQRRAGGGYLSENLPLPPQTSHEEMLVFSCPPSRGGQKHSTSTPPLITSLISPMSRAEYLDIVAQTKEAIAHGEFYQANITRKFTGAFREIPDAFAIFYALCEASPGAYSAFIRMKDVAIISSSPECFLKIDNTGRMESHPIKGTSPRFADKTQDNASRHYLEISAKERAENLMIVDLMRNDFSRSCEPGSIRVERLFEVSTYATLHHMESTITGQKRPDVSTLDAVRNCFPPGSMTGAPKIRAMEWCMEHEKIRRGVYSGALGWFAGDGSCDLSVVIRTLIIKGRRFEFQVGGGITADSDPETEWQETLTKAKGIMTALGADLSLLEEI